MSLRPKGEDLEITSSLSILGDLLEAPEQLSLENSEEAAERHGRRGETVGREPLALRYYDEDRDYQPSVQRAIGVRPSGREVMLDLPATMKASDAKDLANANAHRARWGHESVTWRTGELHPSIDLGSVITLPDRPGLWRVVHWEWFDRGVELGLERLAPGTASTTGAQSGASPPPVDLASTPTHLEFFETPPDGPTAPDETLMFVAASSTEASWRGAALFAEQGDTLLQIGTSGSGRSVIGALTQTLGPSSGAYFEPSKTLELALIPKDLPLQDTDISGLAAGANRLLVGSEVLQFQTATPLGDGVWRLTGLLRGRAGTEPAAFEGHDNGTSVILLDDRPILINDPNLVSSDSARIAALGIADDDAVFASLANPGLSRRPPCPVHPRYRILTDGDLELCWTRRSRGHWRWETQGEVPLVEEIEQYIIGFGPTGSPQRVFTVAEPRLILTPDQQSALTADFGPGDLWVRQVGTYSSSSPLRLIALT